MQAHYEPQKIEPAAQAYWDTHKTFQVTEDASKDKFYSLCMLPYPSGNLHMGHVRNYTIGDVIARFQKMLGKNVLQPMGWDAFGLPAENAAIEHQLAPAQWTYENIAQMRKQFRRLGFGYDWSREFATCNPQYYRWEQWLFLKMHEKGLVYKKATVVNWDPIDQTVLANEQVVDGRGWRSGALVEQKEIEQWFLRITDYADELLDELDNMPGWPEQVRTMQTNWIGRSKGATVTFPIKSHAHEALHIFTTRVDTLMGVTYLAVAPQHRMAELAAKDNPVLNEFIQDCKKGSSAEADVAKLEKRGMPTGLYATHPITGEQLPIWVANFVLMAYGSGAVMAVPGHDERDFEFAQKYHLPIKQVLKPEDASAVDLSTQPYLGHGTLIDSGEFNGLHSKEALQKITEKLKQQKQGDEQIHYRLRDWGISRQRYWGTPIPMINCETCGPQPVPEQDLPVVLPEGLTPTEKGSPLKDNEKFLQASCPHCGEPAQRETDTFDTFVESAWYFARYACPDQHEQILDDRAHYWLPVDQYVGGIEHAVMHLLYARFIYKVLRDLQLVPGDEPFTQLLTQGMVLKDGAKMSKSKGNTVDPNALIEEYGADTVRLFSMFAAPPEQHLEWNDAGVEGAYRYLKRLYKLVYAHCHSDIKPEKPEQWSEAQSELRYHIHHTIKKVTDDIDRRQIFNTAIAAVMELTNVVQKYTVQDSADQAIVKHALESMVLLLAPITPHVCHTLWHMLGHRTAIANCHWPEFDESALKRSTYEMVVQVNGKIRTRLAIADDADDEHIKTQALNDEHVQKHTKNKTIKKVIVVPKRLVNIVAVG